MSPPVLPQSAGRPASGKQRDIVPMQFPTHEAAGLGSLDRMKLAIHRHVEGAVRSDDGRRERRTAQERRQQRVKPHLSDRSIIQDLPAQHGPPDPAAPLAPPSLSDLPTQCVHPAPLRPNVNHTVSGDCRRRSYLLEPFGLPQGARYDWLLPVLTQPFGSWLLSLDASQQRHSLRIAA